MIVRKVFWPTSHTVCLFATSIDPLTSHCTQVLPTVVPKDDNGKEAEKMLSHFRMLIDESASKKKLLGGFFKRAEQAQQQQGGQKNQQQGSEVWVIDSEDGEPDQGQQEQQHRSCSANAGTESAGKGEQGREGGRGREQGSERGNAGGNGGDDDGEKGSKKEGPAAADDSFAPWEQVFTLLAGEVSTEDAQLLCSVAKGDVNRAVDLYYDGRLPQLRQQQGGSSKQSKPAQGKGKQQPQQQSQQQQSQQQGKRKQPASQTGGSGTNKKSKKSSTQQSPQQQQQRSIASFFAQPQSHSQAHSAKPQQQESLVLDIRTPSPERLPPHTHALTPQAAAVTASEQQAVTQQQQQGQEEHMEVELISPSQSVPPSHSAPPSQAPVPAFFQPRRKQSSAAAAAQSSQQTKQQSKSQQQQSAKQEVRQQALSHKPKRGVFASPPLKQSIQPGPSYHKDAVLLPLHQYEPVSVCG